MTQQKATGMELFPTGFDHNNFEKNRVKAARRNKMDHIQNHIGGRLDLEARPCLGYGNRQAGTQTGGPGAYWSGPVSLPPSSPSYKSF